MRERDALNKVGFTSILPYPTPCKNSLFISQGLKKSEGNTERVQHVLKIKEQTMQRLQVQVQALQEETKKQHQQLQRLETEKEGYNKEAMDTKHRCIEQVRHAHSQCLLCTFMAGAK